MSSGPSTSDLFQRGLTDHRAGRLLQAQAAYRQILSIDPAHADAHHALGAALYALGRSAEAEASYREALQLRPSNPEGHNNLGLALQDLGRLAEAEASYREALRLRPNIPDVHNNLGATLYALGRSAEAEASCREALRQLPNYPEALNNLGNALTALGRLAEAAASYREALRLRRDFPEAHNNLGVALNDLGRSAEAEASCREALRLRPNSRAALNNLGNALHNLNRWRESIACFERLLSLKPDDPATKLALCMAELPILYADEAEIANRRASYAARLKSLAALDDVANVAALADAIGEHQPFFLSYQGRNDRGLQAIYGAIACRAMAARYPPIALPPPPGLDEQVRVGIVSGHFRLHASWRVRQGWLEQLDRSRFRLFGYHVQAEQDAETAHARLLCERFVQGPLSTERWRQEIAADAPHVLIYPEVGMSPTAAKLAVQRLAPVQCNTWGHPETSGFPTLDYFLSSDLMEPSDAQQHYCENLIRLPNLSVYLEPIEPPVLASERAAFGMRPSACVYWCAQSLFKYLPQYDPVFPRIALEAGDCQFVFVERPGVTDLFRLRLERAFSQYGLRAEDHCLILPHLEYGQFLAASSLSDVFLDNIGWSSCNTMLDALAYDLPIVTLRGDLMRGRQSAAMLDMMGMTATVCESIEGYVALAVGLARDLARRAEVKRMIAARKHAIYRDRTCILALEEFLDQASRRVGRIS